MDNNLLVTLVALLTAVVSLVASKIGTSKEMKKDIKDIKTSVEIRKEENSILIDASEASLRVLVESGHNGSCKEAYGRLKAYKESCIENRT
jgi:uncharacterized Fe-S cluster-containing protein